MLKFAFEISEERKHPQYCRRHFTVLALDALPIGIWCLYGERESAILSVREELRRPQAKMEDVELPTIQRDSRVNWVGKQVD